MIQALERQGLLDRAIEFLPSDKAIAELKLADKGLTRPELSVLLAYSKMALYRDLIDSGIPDDPYFVHDLARYFPKAMQSDYVAAINAHPLKREIIATVVTNSLVNRAGMTFVHDLSENTGAQTREIAAAYTIARDAFGLRALWSEIEALDTLPAQVQADLYSRVRMLLEHVASWLLRHAPQPLKVEELVSKFTSTISSYVEALPRMHSQATRADYDVTRKALLELGLLPGLVDRMAALHMLSSALDVITVADATQVPLDAVGAVYFDLESHLRLSWLREYAGRIVVQSHWDRMAVQALVHDLYDEQKRVTALVVRALCRQGECPASTCLWQEENRAAIARFLQFLEDLKAREMQDIPALLVALRHVKMLGR